MVYQRDWDHLQALVDQAPPARFYFSDGFATYAQLLYPAGSFYQAMRDKSETYSVEGDNSELRHYLARLGASEPLF